MVDSDITHPKPYVTARTAKALPESTLRGPEEREVGEEKKGEWRSEEG